MGDYNKWHSKYQGVSRQLKVAAADTSVQPFITGKAKYTIFVQRIWMNVTTDAARSVTFVESSGTNPALTQLPVSPGTGIQTFDFGERGVALTEGDNLNLNLSAAGLAFLVKVEAYIRPTGTRTIAQL